MISLTIQHKVYLTKGQRYALHDGYDLLVTGVCLPVWFAKKFTTEPAKEVFCNYYLKNTRKDVPIQLLEDGYEIVLPNREGYRPEISDEKWRELNRKGTIQEEYYEKCVPEVSSKNLLDIKDGGSTSLSYREHNKIKKYGAMTKVAHYVNIVDIDNLKKSLYIIK